MTSDVAVPVPETAAANGHGEAHTTAGFGALTLGSIGVVYGDIGTSPLYALREAIVAATGATGSADPAVVLGILSLILWALIVVVTLKYVLILLRADNNGEGGTLVGAPVRGRVLIVDDVMSAGTAARESIAIIRAAGATPHAVAIALDRQEKATENGTVVEHSAVQYVRGQLGLEVCAIARLADLLQYLQRQSGDALGVHYAQVLAYRKRYGVD